MKGQKTKKSQHNTEEQTWGTHATLFKDQYKASVIHTVRYGTTIDTDQWK